MGMTNCVNCGQSREACKRLRGSIPEVVLRSGLIPGVHGVQFSLSLSLSLTHTHSHSLAYSVCVPSLITVSSIRTTTIIHSPLFLATTTTTTSPIMYMTVPNSSLYLLTNLTPCKMESTILLETRLQIRSSTYAWREDLC